MKILKKEENLNFCELLVILESTIISQCGNITRVSLLLAFIGKLIKEETSLKVITSGSIRGIQASIESPSTSANCKF